MNDFNKKHQLVETYTLIGIDIICILLSYVTSFYMRQHGEQRLNQVDGIICLILVVTCLLYGLLVDWNHFIFKRGYYDEFIAVLKYNIGLLIVISSTVFLFQFSVRFSRLVFAYFAVINMLTTYIGHTLFKKYMYKFYRRSTNSDKVVVYTTEEHLEEIAGDVLEENAWDYQVLEYIVMDGSGEEKETHGIPVRYAGEDVYEELKRLPVDAVLLYLPEYPAEKIVQYIKDLETMGITCHYSVSSIGKNIQEKSVGYFAKQLVLTYSVKDLDYRRMFIKRLVDIIGGLLGSLFTIIVTPLVALAIKLESKGPVFFSQMRIGRNGRRFKMYKFRSMYVDAEERKKELMAQNEMQGLMFKMENDPRITRVGKFIRKTSIDELPQFFNVVKGDMSLVGTRPPTIDEFEQYDIHYRRRLSITPGLTGMWQVSGRSNITDFDQVVKYDLEYIDHWSLMLDFKILLQTVIVVLFGKGSK